MCGIVGCVGEVNFKEKRAFRTLLELDTTRGPHSTGVVSVGYFNNEVIFDKKLGTPWDFYEKSQMVDAKGIVGQTTKMLIGHNRFATTGEINDENAHPFDFENVIGVHNGTINCWRSLAWLKENGSNHPVDSHRLYDCINKFGLEHTITNIDGAWSLAWYDKEHKTFNLFRNDKRPMSYALAKGRKTMFFASEAWMIQVACNMNDIEIEGIHQTRTDNWYFVDLSHNQFVTKGVNLTFYQNKILGKKYPAIVTEVGNYNSPFSGLIGPKNTKEISTPLSRVCDSKGLMPIYYDHHRSVMEKPAYKNSKFAKIVLYTLIEDHAVHIFIDTDKYNTDELFKKYSQSSGFFTTRPNSYVSSTNKDFIIYANQEKISEEIPWEELEVDVFEEIEKSNKEDELIKVAHGELITKEDFLKLIKKETCCFCGTDYIDPKDADKIIWTYHQGQFICPSCAEHEANRGLFSLYNIGN